MAVISISKIQVRRGQELQTGIPQLDPGEFGWAEDTEHLYIGKRIIEGAVDDTNTRILTENDLDYQNISKNVFSYIRQYLSTGTAVASTSTYKYRDGISYVKSEISTIAVKLDNWVSLTDYGVKESSTGTDITTALQEAIYSLFAGKDAADDGVAGASPFVTNIPDTRRRLIIPPGSYVVTEVVDLPPFTSLVGEGPELTTIQFIPDPILTPSAMFRTVDANGNSFSSGSMDPSILDGENSRNISIEGMTLEFTATNIVNVPLLSLEQATDVNIRNVNFSTANLSTMTQYGNAISMQSDIVSDVNNAPAGNINIENCKFSYLNTAITQSTGTVNRFYIKNCVFGNLYQGISIWANTDGTYRGPSNGVIDSNRFENIVYQAITLGTSTYSSAISNTVSSNNTFRTVANGPDINGNPSGDYTTPYFDSTTATNIANTGSTVIRVFSTGSVILGDTFGDYSNPSVIIAGTVVTAIGSGTVTLSTATIGVIHPNDILEFFHNYLAPGPVVVFNSLGNKSINDTFSRQQFAEEILLVPQNNFYYYPLVLGSTVLNDNGTRVYKTIGGFNDIGYFPMTAHDQLLSVRYLMYNANYSRKGTLWINILGQSSYANDDPVGSVSDYYNFSYVNPLSSDPTFNVDSTNVGSQNYVVLQMIEYDGADYTIEYQIDSVL